MTQWRARNTHASFMVWVSDLCVCSFVPLVKTAFTYTYVIEFGRSGKTPISPSPNFWTCSYHNVLSLKHNHGTPSLYERSDVCRHTFLTSSSREVKRFERQTYSLLFTMHFFVWFHYLTWRPHEREAGCWKHSTCLHHTWSCTAACPPWHGHVVELCRDKECRWARRATKWF